MNLRAFDIHSKVRDDARITTSTGGAVSLASLVLVLLLFSSELYTYLATPPKEILSVDRDRSQRLPIYFSVTFPNLACKAISVDTSDVSGEEHHDIAENIYKVPIARDGSVAGAPHVISNINSARVPASGPGDIPEDAVELSGNATGGLGRKAPKDAIPNINDKDYCGDCYGAGLEGECCNTCDQVKEAYRRKGWMFFGGSDIVQCAHESIKNDLHDIHDSGCEISGEIHVAKVKGKLMFTPSAGNLHVHHAVHSLHGTVVNTSHIVQYLRFGSKVPNYKDASPLENHVSLIEEADVTATFRYHISIVPTSYEKSTGKITKTNQYAVTQDSLFMDAGDFHETPGVFFEYDISPIRVHVLENPRSLITFLTNLAAILGGVVTMASILDSVLFHSTRRKL